MRPNPIPPYRSKSTPNLTASSDDTPTLAADQTIRVTLEDLRGFDEDPAASPQSPQSPPPIDASRSIDAPVYFVEQIGVFRGPKLLAVRPSLTDARALADAIPAHLGALVVRELPLPWCPGEEHVVLESMRTWRRDPAGRWTAHEQPWPRPIVD